VFYHQDASNFYLAVLDTFDNFLRLYRVVGGVPVLLDSQDMTFATVPLTLVPGVYYGLRVDVVKSGATNLIRVYLDATKYLETTDSTFTKGAVGFHHDAQVASVECDEVEMALIPIETELLDLGS
jgi:hypothetical protein